MKNLSTKLLALFTVVSAATSVRTAHAEGAATQPVHVGFVGEGGRARVDGVSVGLPAARLDELRGLQLAAGAGVLRDLAGVQVAGGVTVATGDATGVQLAPVTYAARLRGVQVGAVNVADELEGFQLAPVNIARRGAGFRLGVVNVLGEHEGEALGVLTFARGGVHDVSVYTSDTMLGNVALKLGTRHLYTGFHFSHHPGNEAEGGSGRFERDTRRFGMGVALGWRFPVAVGPLAHVDLELSGTSVRAAAFGAEAGMLAAARLQAAVELAPHLKLIVGAGMNTSFATSGGALDIGTGFLEQRLGKGDPAVRLFPGLTLGLST